MLLGTVTTSEEAAQVVGKTDVAKRLGEVIQQKDMGEDIMLQILYTLNQ
jgi:hypothetical protein